MYSYYRSLPVALALVAVLIAGTASAQACADWSGDPIQLQSQSPAADPDLLVWSGDSVYTCGDELIAWNVSDLAAPVQLGSWTPPEPISDACIEDGFLYLACESAGVQVVDAYDMSLVSSFAPGAAITGVAVCSDGLLAVASDSSFYVVDLYNPGKPESELNWKIHVTTPIAVRYVAASKTSERFYLSGDSGIVACEIPAAGPNYRCLWTFQEIPETSGDAESITFGRIYRLPYDTSIYVCAQVHATCDDGILQQPCTFPFLARIYIDYTSGNVDSSEWVLIGDGESSAMPTSFDYNEYGIMVGLTQESGAGSVWFFDYYLTLIRSLTLEGTDEVCAELQDGRLVVAGGSGGLHTYTVPSLIETTSISRFYTADTMGETWYATSSNSSFQYIKSSSCMGTMCQWQSKIYDVRDPMNVSKVYSGSGYSDGGYATSERYLGNYKDYLYLIEEWNDPYYGEESYLMRAGGTEKMIVPNDVWGWGGRPTATGDGDVLWLLDRYGLLRSADLSAFPSLVYLGSLQTSVNLVYLSFHVGAQNAFLIEEDPIDQYRLVALGLDDPANPSLLGSLDLPGRPSYRILERDTQLLLEFDTQFVVVDLSDPSTPVQAGSIITDGSVIGLSNNGGTFLVAVEYYRTHLLEWSMDGELAPLAEIPTDGQFRGGAAISGHLLYLGDQITGIELYDLSDPYQPLHVARAVPADQSNLHINNLCVIEGYLVAPGEIYPLDCSDPVFGISAVFDDADPVTSPRFLSRPYPNPFNPQTKIEWTVTTVGPIEIAVYDLAGRRVKTLFSGTMEPGPASAIWYGDDEAGRDMPSGVYFFHAEIGERTQTEKGVLVR